jgi:hypothetical protein
MDFGNAIAVSAIIANIMIAVISWLTLIVRNDESEQYKIPLTEGRWLGKKFPDHLAKDYRN